MSRTVSQSIYGLQFSRLKNFESNGLVDGHDTEALFLSSEMLW